MRRIFLASTLVIASCAPRPEQTAAPLPQQPQAQPVERGELTGLTPNALVQRFGTPALQIREGSSLKLQFRNNFCVLDAYLYPSQGGQMVVTHVDARDYSAAATDQAACIRAFEPAI